MIELHNRMVVLGLHLFYRVFKFLLKLGGFKNSQSLLLVALVAQLFGQRVALNELPGNYLLHCLGKLLFACLHVLGLLVDLHAFNICS